VRLQLSRSLRRVAGFAITTITIAWTTPTRAQDLDSRVALEYGQYADSDHVFVETPSIHGAVTNPVAGWSADARYLVDVVSAASVDIVSTASRNWNEVRQEGELHGEYKPGAIGGGLSGDVSSEPDYLSWSAGGELTLDLLDKNLTLQLGYGHGHDVAGRTGTPFSVFSRVLHRDALSLAASVVLDAATILTSALDVDVEYGDPSKPYRYIPLFAPGTNVPVGAPIDLVNQLRLGERPLEQLPLTRQRYALTTRLAHRYRRSTLRLEERLYADSWAMLATTSDARLLFDLGERVETGPHGRVHAQSAVSFWERAYTLGPGFDFPAIRTGDRELGPLVNLTAGWTFEIALGTARNLRSWVLGLHLNATSTQYLDDLYVTQRVSAVGGVSLEAGL
jgi:hypothetical protein